MNKEIQPNQANHLENLRRLDGYFYHGTYFEKGLGRPGKKKKEKKWKRKDLLENFMLPDH